MLDAIRKRSGSIVVKVLLMLLVLSFGAWGVGDYITGNVSNANVASVGDREISQQRFNREMQREVNRLRNMLGDAIDIETVRNLGLQDQVLGRMIRTELFNAAADDNGIVASNEQVSAMVQAMPAFQGVTGGFDKQQFLQAIAGAGYGEQGFIALVRDEMRRAQVLGSVQAGSNVPNAVTDMIFAYRGETRTAEVSLISDDAFVDVATPNDEEVAAFHNENQNLFMAPEYRALTFIHLNAADLTGNIAVGEDELFEAYGAREAEFMSAARRNIDQALFSDEATAKRAVARIADGEGFEDVAADLSGASTGSLALGWVTRGDLLEEMADTAFSTPVGSVSAAVESSLGWHVLRINEAEEEGMRSLDEVRDTLRGDVALEKAVDALFSLANQLDDELGGGATLEEAANRLNLPITSVDSVDSSGSDRSGTSVAGLPGDDFIRAAFTTPEGQETPLSESGSDAYFVVRVDGVDTPALRPLESVRDAVVQAIVAQRRTEQARIAAEQVVEGLNNGGELFALVKPFGATVSVAEGFMRDGTGSSVAVPRTLSTGLFAVTPSQGALARAGEGFMVGHLRSVTPVNRAANAEAYDAVADELVRGMRDSLVDQLAMALEKKYSVSINRSAVDQAF